MQHFFILLFASLSQANIQLKTTSIAKTLVNNHTKSNINKIENVNSTAGTDQIQVPSSGEIASIDTTADEIKNEVSVNDLLEDISESDDEIHDDEPETPNYDLNWAFIDKDTIRVTFDLFSIPISLIENNKNSLLYKRKYNVLATMTTAPSRTMKSITLLRYYRFIIRPYNKNRDIILKLEKLILRNSTSKRYHHFSSGLRLTELNHHEKYSICICYFQNNISLKTPDLILCQDIINDYSKYSNLRTDAKHGLVFITTQYSIIIALLIVLQSVYSMRKRRFTQYIGQIVANKAQSIRSTLSSVSLVRQSFSSLDAAAEQQHAMSTHAPLNDSTIKEEETGKTGGFKKRIISSPAIVVSQQQTNTSDHGAHSSDENEPFLKRIPSKNHVHFLLGPGEGSDEDEAIDEDDENKHDDSNSSPHSASSRRGPYDDQQDALLSMAHILDTNKPWSRHTHQTSPV